MWLFVFNGFYRKNLIAKKRRIEYTERVGFLTKFIARIVLNALALYVAKIYLSGFIVAGGLETLLVGGLVLAFLNAFIRPILRLVTLPLLVITFGLFNIIIHVVILLIADAMLSQLMITGFSTLFFASIIIALANTFF